MRNLGAPAGYFAVVLMVLGVATLAIGDVYRSAAKANRDLDADIDRIIAQQQQKKRLAAMIAESDHIVPAAPATALHAQAKAQNTVASLEESELQRENVADKKAQTAAQSSKRPVRRNSRRAERFLPAAFASLPKFAVTSAAATVLWPVR